MIFLQDWFKYFKAMKNAINSNKELKDLFKHRYYVVFFNAELKKYIAFAGQKFLYSNTAKK